MTDSRITKIIAGSYQVGNLGVFRNGREWLVTGAQRETESYRSQSVAILAALVITGQATDEESDTFRRSI